MVQDNGNRDLARMLRILSVSTRLRILELLKDRTLCVSALAARLGVTQGAVSQHLRIMRDAGLVIDERRGYYVHYRLNAATLVQWRAATGSLLAPSGQEEPASARPTARGDRPCADARRRSKAARSPRP